MSLSNHLKDSWTATGRRRGRAYWDAGRVGIIDQDAQRITASVYGKRSYDVVLKFNGHDELTFRTSRSHFLGV